MTSRRSDQRDLFTIYSTFQLSTDVTGTREKSSLGSLERKSRSLILTIKLRRHYLAGNSIALILLYLRPSEIL